jgi:hypothetical protein
MLVQLTLIICINAVKALKQTAPAFWLNYTKYKKKIQKIKNLENNTFRKNTTHF